VSREDGVREEENFFQTIIGSTRKVDPTIVQMDMESWAVSFLPIRKDDIQSILHHIVQEAPRVETPLRSHHSNNFEFSRI